MTRGMRSSMYLTYVAKEMVIKNAHNNIIRIKTSSTDYHPQPISSYLSDLAQSSSDVPGYCGLAFLPGTTT